MLRSYRSLKFLNKDIFFYAEVFIEILQIKINSTRSDMKPFSSQFWLFRVIVTRVYLTELIFLSTWTGQTEGLVDV